MLLALPDRSSCSTLLETNLAGSRALVSFVVLLVLRGLAFKLDESVPKRGTESQAYSRHLHVLPCAAPFPAELPAAICMHILRPRKCGNGGLTVPAVPEFSVCELKFLKSNSLLGKKKEEKKNQTEFRIFFPLVEKHCLLKLRNTEQRPKRDSDTKCGL